MVRMKNHKAGALFTCVIGILCVLSAGTLLPLSTQAASGLPPRPTSSLPSRQPGSQPTPNPRAASSHGRGSQIPVGGYIEAHIPAIQTELWTIVQWQDELENWHDVEGWQGTLDAGNKKVWWVAAADFGKGPFRWTVYQAQGGELLSESPPFYLPDSAGETVRIEVSLVP